MNYYSVQYIPVKTQINYTQRIITNKKIKFYGTRKLIIQQKKV